MYKCEFFTKYILARTQSMDFPMHTNTGAVAECVISEATKFWDALNNKFAPDEIFKTDIRGNIRGIQS